MASLLDQIYSHSPVWLQNIGVSAYGAVWKHRRMGGNFKQYVRSFKERESFTNEEWESLQIGALRQLLTSAFKNVPYYFETMRSAGITKSDLTEFNLDEIDALPRLEKDTIRQHPSLLVDQRVNLKRLHTYHTSGTTGTPMEIKFTKGMHRTWSAAYEARCRNWAGVHSGMKRVMIGGRIVVPTAESKPPYWRHNLAERQLYMSAFHISPRNAKHYAEAMNRFKPDYLVGYASSHYFLARMLREQGLQTWSPIAVLTSSEKLTPEMRSTIENVYHCPVFDAYSGVEACCLTSECEFNRMHISPDVGVIELLGEDGKNVRSGQPGEIVATGLLNFAQPLIRYRTGDLAIASDETCPCGRNMPVIRELVGRLEDTVIGSDGREMVRFHGIFVGLPNILEGQVIQETLKDFRLRLVVDPNFSLSDRHSIQARFQERLGEVNIQFEYVSEIERTEAGKFRAVVSRVGRIPLVE